jgi:hypothetical protein
MSATNFIIASVRDTAFLLPPLPLPGVRVFLMTATAHFPGPHRSSAADSDVDGLEPSPERTGDADRRDEVRLSKSDLGGVAARAGRRVRRRLRRRAHGAEVQRTGRPGPAACRGANSRSNLVSDHRPEVTTASSCFTTCPAVNGGHRHRSSSAENIVRSIVPCKPGARKDVASPRFRPNTRDRPL